ncbi:hypothetical protein [Ramlibacter humi]|uniref:DUF998 domain-containing protein n=1 Tax=Ramlibacter humi TaxID=2530451 RepID=A0A4Z0BLF9_9BURK|nr:hypothetical protein [Ramlibacter humi]TFZ00163.1 hypothetical protein EZ216_13725 [Ramlibacter humi]
MAHRFKLYEIDRQTLKLIVGVIALSLPWLTNYFAGGQLDSISASYHAGGWARDILVGFLFAICAFLLAYNGEGTLEMVMSKVAALAALGVAMFPCECGGRDQIIRGVHGASAAVMFLVLAGFCLVFYGRAKAKPGPQARVRGGIYLACAAAILGSIAVIGYDQLTGGSLRNDGVPTLVFRGEAVGLVAFGVSWLVASRVLPLLTADHERVRLLSHESADAAAAGTRPATP